MQRLLRRQRDVRAAVLPAGPLRHLPGPRVYRRDVRLGRDDGRDVDLRSRDRCARRSRRSRTAATSRICARRRGTLSMSDGGYYPTCTATGPVECVDVPFTIPSATPVIGALPGASPCPATLPADGPGARSPGVICDYPGTDPAGVCRPRATCEVKTPAINWSVTQPAATCGTHPSPCPATFASIPLGGACPAGANPLQTTCDYVEGRCGCVSCFDDAGASGTMWSCRAWDAGAGSSCSARAPLAGSACSTAPTRFVFMAAAHRSRSAATYNVRAVIGRNAA